MLQVFLFSYVNYKKTGELLASGAIGILVLGFGAWCVTSLTGQFRDYLLHGSKLHYWIVTGFAVFIGLLGVLFGLMLLLEKAKPAEGITVLLITSASLCPWFYFAIKLRHHFEFCEL